jgi:hypothetical protein
MKPKMDEVKIEEWKYLLWKNKNIDKKDILLENADIMEPLFYS